VIYLTLQQEVIDHLCERYFSLKGIIARYELAAHIRTHNLPLYLDLVLTGLLRQRGGALTKDDEWLSSCPSYRKNSKVAFLLPNYDCESNESIVIGDESYETELTDKESALWFRLPYINGKRPGRDVPWVRFKGEDRGRLEHRYMEAFKEGKCKGRRNNNATRPSPCGSENVSIDRNDVLLENGLEIPSTPLGVASEIADDDKSDKSNGNEKNPGGIGLDVSSSYPTFAQWYVPDVSRDVFVDQKRYSVSFHSCCPRCRQPLRVKSKFADVCKECSDSQEVVTNHWIGNSILSPPPISMLMRPNLWRFHGPGDEVRRAVWFLDTRRHGLQPYGEEAQVGPVILLVSGF